MTGLREAVQAGLAAVAEPQKATKMQAYMKSEMPYCGVSAVPLENMCKRIFAGLRYANAQAWRNDVLALWRGAKYREERYAAIALTGVRAAQAFQRFDAMAMYEEMVISGAWWDYVDTIATQRLWEVLCNDPAPMKALMRR